MQLGFTMFEKMHLDAGHLSGGQLKLLEFGACFMVPPRIATLTVTAKSNASESKALGTCAARPLFALHLGCAAQAAGGCAATSRC